MKATEPIKQTFTRISKKIYLLGLIILIAASVFSWAYAAQKSKELQSGEPANSTAEVNGDGVIHILDGQASGHSFGKTSGTHTPTPALISCLTSPSLIITLSGNITSFTNKNLTESTRIDATTATFRDGGEHPVNFGGGADVCWHSGKIYGGYPLDASWETTHPTAGIQIQDGTPRPIVEGVYIDQIGDGIKVRLGENSGQAGIAEPFTVRGVWLRDIRDDCIESDWQAGALIEDSLLDGCYVVFATKKRPSASTNGSNNIWEIRDTLAYLHDQIGVYKGSSPGHGMFFKWDDTSPKWKMYNSILRVDSNVSQSSNQFDFPLEKLVDCRDNILVWLGPGSFPATVPSCFTVTTDKSVWDDAVISWKIRHGYSP